MKKYLLLLAAGAIALPGLAIADAHGYSQSISGQVRTQHQSVTNGDLTTVDNNLGGGDTHLTWNHSYQASETKSVSGFIRFEAGNDQRISVTGTDSAGDWTASAKGEWDTTGLGAVTSYRDQFVTLSNVSGMYVTLGNKQYGDVAKGLDTAIGGTAGDFQDNHYFVTGESRYEALQLGYSMGNGVDISAVLQLDNGVGLFGGMASLDDEENVTGDANTSVNSADQRDVSGTLLLVKYNANNVDAQLEIYSGGIAGVDNADDGGDMAEDREVSASATLLAVAYDAGQFTPFLNYSTRTVTTTDAAGADSDDDRTATQFGVVASVGGGSLGLALGSESESESSMTEVDYTTTVGGVTVKGMLGSGTDGNGAADDTDRSYYAFRLQYAF